ncbi:hypothetical protein EKK58_11095 [Candidatus Dependentiae bacterium]|nr:MAG: hypothetical protein EKK58_11095 [Candidatus Dependentiae bacterium]
MKTYKIEVTDTFGGEANYSYVSRLTIQAKSLRACVLQLGKETGYNWRFKDNLGECVRYDTTSGLTCAFIEGVTDET